MIRLLAVSRGCPIDVTDKPVAWLVGCVTRGVPLVVEHGRQEQVAANELACKLRAMGYESVKVQQKRRMAPSRGK